MRGSAGQTGLIVAIVILAAAETVLACRYTIRDIGFVQFTPQGYTLTGPAGTDDAMFGGSNVTYLAGIDATYRLAAPDGRVLTIDDPVDAIRSTVRDRLLAECLDTFAFVLLVGSGDDVRDATARSTIEAATRQLRQVESLLPRPIDLPLRTIHLEPDDEADERVLAWSLGLKTDAAGPSIVVLYGRGKRAGPILRGSTLTPDELLQQLVLVGESCECDTDRDWFGEPSIPMAWPRRHRDNAVGRLGFNPDSPVVKAEVSRILARGPEDRRAADTSLGYGEVTIPAAVEGPIDGGDAVATPGRLPPATTWSDDDTVDDDWSFTSNKTPTEPSSPSERTSRFGPVGAAVLGITALSAVGALLILFRRRPT